MPEIKVYQDEEKAARDGVPSWTFSVDGQASGYWCQSEHAARRVVGRLEQGRSREAFGADPAVRQAGSSGGLVIAGRAKVSRAEGESREEKVVMRGGREKTRTFEPGWRAEVDGNDLGEFATEQEARRAAAIAAFMTRGKLGRLKEAEEQFEAEYGVTGRAAYDGKSVTVVSEDGARYAVRLMPGRPPVFKPLKAE